MPSDLPEADASDAAGPVGVFASASLRPLALGAGMTGIVLGVVIGVWMTLVGARHRRLAGRAARAGHRLMRSRS